MKLHLETDQVKLYQADVLAWALWYKGEIDAGRALPSSNHFLQLTNNHFLFIMNVIFPKNNDAVAVLDSNLAFFSIIGKVLFLHSFKVISIVKSRVGVPESAVSLYQDIMFIKREVKNITLKLKLPGVNYV